MSEYIGLLVELLAEPNLRRHIQRRPARAVILGFFFFFGISNYCNREVPFGTLLVLQLRALFEQLAETKVAHLHCLVLIVL